MSEEVKLREKIQELESTIRTLREDLIHDSLTGLKTRKFFEEEVGLYLRVMEDQHGTKRKEWFNFKNMSIVLLDIDHFKNINDTYGHQVGDEVLRKVAETIEQGLRDADIAARWGGEEIALVLVGANEEEAGRKAERIRKSIEMLTFENPQDLKVSVSLGVTEAEANITLDEMVKRADEALYKAKETGRNKVVSYGELG